MKVYVVVDISTWESYYIVGVFMDKDKAIDCLIKCLVEHFNDPTIETIIRANPTDEILDRWENDFFITEEELE